MDRASFDQIKVTAEQDLALTEENILHQSYNIINLHRKYFNLYVHEQKLLKDIEVKNGEYRGKYFIGLKSGTIKVDGLQGYDLSKKVDFEELINQDKEYFRQLLIINQQKEIVNFLENLLDNINKINYAIKNFIELKKFRDGYL